MHWITKLLRPFTRGIPSGSTNGNARLSICPEVRTSLHVDGLALLHIRTGRVYVCNRTGARIWQGAAKGLSIDSITDEISREYRVTKDLARQDTCSFLSELERLGFAQAVN